MAAALSAVKLQALAAGLRSRAESGTNAAGFVRQYNLYQSAAPTAVAFLCPGLERRVTSTSPKAFTARASAHTVGAGAATPWSSYGSFSSDQLPRTPQGGFGQGAKNAGKKSAHVLSAAEGSAPTGSDAGPSDKDLLMSIAGQLTGLSGQVSGLCEDVSSVKESLSTLSGEMVDVQEDLARLSGEVAGHTNLLGTLVEASSRARIRDMFGGGYEKPLLARSLQDLVLLLPEEAVFESARSMRVLEGPLERATQVSKALVDAGIPAQVLKSIQDGAGQKGWIGADGTFNGKALGIAISTTPDEALKATLNRLRRVLQKPTKSEQVQELLTCEGPGILCLVAAALPELFLRGRPNIIPPDEVEFDCRGRMDVSQDGTAAYIDVGEVKRRLDYASAVPQLGIRLAALKWFVCKACSAKPEGFRLVGRMFVFHQGSEVFIDNAQRAEASKKWGYSLYVHKL